jgi:hypothetical protein
VVEAEGARLDSRGFRTDTLLLFVFYVYAHRHKQNSQTRPKSGVLLTTGRLTRLPGTVPGTHADRNPYIHDWLESVRIRQPEFGIATINNICKVLQSWSFVVLCCVAVSLVISKMSTTR